MKLNYEIPWQRIALILFVVLNIAAKIRMGATHGEVLTELTHYLTDKKHISIKYALSVAERIIQMVEKEFEECDD